MLGEQAVSVEVKVTDERHIDTHAIKLITNVGNGLRRLGGIHGQAHHFRASQCQFLDLNGSFHCHRRVGIGHGLHAHRRPTTEGDHALAPNDACLQGAPCIRESYGARNILLHY